MLTVVPAVVVGDSDGAASPSVSLLDEIVREGARRMLAAAVEAEVAADIDPPTSTPTPTSWTSRAGGWWSVTGTPSRGSWSLVRGRWRWSRRG